MHYKYLSSILTFWHFAIFIILFTHQSFGSDVINLIERDTSSDRSHIPKNILAISPIGGTHLPSMLEISKILMDRGYNVTLIAPDNYTARSISYRSIPQISFDNGFSQDSPEFKNALLDNDFRKLSPFINKLSVSSYVHFYNFYKQVAEEINPDLFFCDILINNPCFDLAWKLRKPVVGISSDLSRLTPYKPDPIFGCHLNMKNESFYNRFRCGIIVPLQQYWHNREIIKGLNVQRTSIGVDPHWDINGRISNILLLSNNFFGFEIPKTESPLHQEIGPILPDVFPSLTPALDSFLTVHPRTLYFAIGTNAVISSKNVITLLKSFIELINQNIIDGVIWSTLRTNTIELLQLTNSTIPISAILNNEHPHIYISKYSPQFAILAHENTKIFLSHGGAASSHESMYNGKPMLVLPIMGDQPRNAEKLELAGIALTISKFNLEVDDIISKVKRLLNEESFKNSAKRLQFLAKVNSKRKHRAADLIEIVMNTVRYEGVRDENGEFRVDNANLLRDWIIPDMRIGYDVYGVAIALCGGFGYILLKIASYFYIKYRHVNRYSKKLLKPKKA